LGDPVGPDFVQGTPTGWGAANPTPNATYAVGLNEMAPHGGKASLAIIGLDSASRTFQGIGQAIKATDYAGKRVRFSAWIKHTDLKGPTIGLWMRIDGDGQVLAFDNMTARHLAGTSDWHVVEIILDVPDNAIGMSFGALMSGSGTMLVDDMTLEVLQPVG